MSRLPTVEPENAPAGVKSVYEAFLRERGAVPNMFVEIGGVAGNFNFFNRFNNALAWT